MAKKAPTAAELQQQNVNRFVKNLWFFGFYFVMLLMIASFGLIAEV